MFLSKQQGRFGRYAMLAGVIACASFAATAAQAGGCPADQTKPDVRPPVDLKPVGVTDTVIAKMGKKVMPPTPESIHRLKTYHWPGNVRELQNVIERAVITSVDGNLNLDRALPDLPHDSNNAGPRQAVDRRVRSAKELMQLERENLLLAMETTGWRIAGKDGAAQLLGLKPSTLTSRMKALGIERPKPEI